MQTVGIFFPPSHVCTSHHPLPTSMSGTPSLVSKAAGAARPRRSFPPRTVGSWKIDALLGEGTFARIYRARPANCPLQRPADYALKLLRKEFEDDELAVQMIRREAYVGRHVSSPHLVPVLDYAVSKPPFHVVMPYLHGTAVRVAGRGDWLPVPHALWIARQVAEALSSLHEHDWLHGDVKPSNVFVSAEGHATLVDLGMARRIQAPGHLLDRPVTGTLNYLPPELISSAVRADQRSDIYSLGVTLYGTLTGRLPFTADTVDGLLRAHREMSVPDPRRVRPQIPGKLRDFLLQMMAKQPLRRPQTAKEVVDRLMEFEIETFEDRFAA